MRDKLFELFQDIFTFHDDVWCCAECIKILKPSIKQIITGRDPYYCSRHEELREELVNTLRVLQATAEIKTATIH